jgi:hypothetical protein
MMLAIRARAGAVVSGALLLAGCSLGAHAAGVAGSDAVSRAELYGTLGAAGVVVFAAFWTLLGSHTARMERIVEGLVESVNAHQSSDEAHPKAIQTRSRPILDKLESLDGKLDETREVMATLLAEHRMIRASEAEICRLVRRAPKRAGDPEDVDYAEIREP